MSEYVVFLENGAVVNVIADHAEYDENYLDLYDNEDRRVAMFNTEKIFGYFKKVNAQIGGLNCIQE